MTCNMKHEFLKCIYVDSFMVGKAKFGCLSYDKVSDWIDMHA